MTPRPQSSAYRPRTLAYRQWLARLNPVAARAVKWAALAGEHPEPAGNGCRSRRRFRIGARLFCAHQFSPKPLVAAGGPKAGPIEYFRAYCCTHTDVDRAVYLTPDGRCYVIGARLAGGRLYLRTDPAREALWAPYRNAWRR
jgi:hypothetical protein